jgi:hypothetical protein
MFSPVKDSPSVVICRPGSCLLQPKFWPCLCRSFQTVSRVDEQLSILYNYGTDKLKEGCGEMTILVLDKAVCGRYDQHDCDKYNEKLDFNNYNSTSLIILHYVHVMSLFTV